VDSGSDGGENIDERTPIDLADPQEVMKYYESALKHFQQINCRVVDKEFIKFIEPRKQHNYPYNGGDQRKPKWWPADVMHKEPDHLLKNGILARFVLSFRIILMLSHRLH
jgi:hypothetical protein